MSLSALFVKALCRRRTRSTFSPSVRPRLELLENRLVPAHLELGLDPPPIITGTGLDGVLRQPFDGHAYISENNRLQAVWPLHGNDVEENDSVTFHMNASKLSLQLLADSGDPIVFPVTITVGYSYNMQAHFRASNPDEFARESVNFQPVLDVLPADSGDQRQDLFNAVALTGPYVPDDGKSDAQTVSVNSVYVSSFTSIWIDVDSFFATVSGYQFSSSLTGEIDIDLDMTITVQVEGGGAPAPSIRPGGLNPTDGRMLQSSALNLDPIGQAAIALVVSPASESQHQPGGAGFSESLGWRWTPQMTLTGSLPAVETGSLADSAGLHRGLSPVSREARSNWLMATFDSLELVGTVPSRWLDADPWE